MRRLDNLRDLSEARPDVLRSGKVWRSAAPRSKRASFLNAWEGLDLRSRGERDVEGNPQGLSRVHMASMGDRERIGSFLFQRLDVMDMSRAIWCRMTSDSATEREIFAKRINRGGLPLLNELLLEAHPREFRTAFETVERCLIRDVPLLFFCAAGKDRTGLLAMFILSVSGVDEPAIVEDYARSNNEAARKIALDGFRTYEREGGLGLDIEKFVHASPEVMEHTLGFLRTRYGGPEGYLLRSGVSSQCLESVRRRMRLPIDSSYT